MDARVQVCRLSEFVYNVLSHEKFLTPYIYLAALLEEAGCVRSSVTMRKGAQVQTSDASKNPKDIQKDNSSENKPKVPLKMQMAAIKMQAMQREKDAEDEKEQEKERERRKVSDKKAQEVLRGIIEQSNAKKQDRLRKEREPEVRS